MVLGEVNEKTRIPKGLGPVSCYTGVTGVGSELLLWIAARHAHAFPLNRCGPVFIEDVGCDSLPTQGT
jgi:hypothetical protein